MVWPGCGKTTKENIIYSDQKTVENKEKHRNAFELFESSDISITMHKNRLEAANKLATKIAAKRKKRGQIAAKRRKFLP